MAQLYCSLPEAVRNNVFSDPNRLVSMRGYPDLRDFSETKNHPLWCEVERLERGPLGWTQFCIPVSLELSKLIPSLSSLHKAAFEARRMRTMITHWETFESKFNSSSFPAELRCACMSCDTEIPLWPDTRELTVGQLKRFRLALAFLHQELPDFHIQKSGLNLGQWTAALARDPQVLEAAATFVVIAHGAVICPRGTPFSELASAPPPPPRAPLDDPDEVILSAALLKAVKSGTHGLLNNTADMSRDIPFINGQFVVRDSKLMENLYPGQAIRRTH